MTGPKIVYFNYLFDRKYSSVGAAVHVREFVAAARKLGANIRSFDLNKFGSEEQAVESKSRAWLKQKLSRYVGQLNALLSNVGCFRRELKIIREQKPDAIIVRYNLLNFSAAVLAKVKGIPFFLEVNAPMALENKSFNDKTVSLPFIPEWIELLNMKLATRAYTVSHALKQYYVEKGIATEKIDVIPNGVDVERFHPGLSGQGVREKHGLGNETVIGFIGSFHYWHGVDCFEEYVEALSAEYDNVRFLFVGDGPLKAGLEQRISAKGLRDRVTFAGYVPHDDIPQYLAAMDIVLAPYPAMTFFYFSPLKLFEYMAAGKAVIASRVGQITEMIESEKNGLLYDAGNVSELMEKTRRLIEDVSLRQKLGRQARKTICENYSWEVNARKVLELVNQATGINHTKVTSDSTPDQPVVLEDY